MSSAGYSDWWYLAWRPDGQEVWFGASESGRENPLYAIDLTGRRRMLLRVPGSLELHDISRDGRLLVTKTNQGIAMAGLSRGQTREHDLSWHDYSSPGDISGDGDTLVFTESGDAGGKRGKVYLRKADGSPAVMLGEGYAQGLSPDRRWVASVGVPNDVFLLPTGPGQPRKLTYKQFEIIHRASWYPDGRRLLLVAREAGHQARLYAQPIDGGEPRAIAPEGFGFDFDYGGNRPLSPDGTLVAAINADGKVFLIGTDGGTPRAVAGVELEEQPIGWSADSRSIYVFRRGELPAKVVRVDVLTGHRTLWKELVPNDVAGVVGLNGVVIAPDGRSYAYCYGRYVSDLYVVEGVK